MTNPTADAIAALKLAAERIRISSDVYRARGDDAGAESDLLAAAHLDEVRSALLSAQGQAGKPERARGEDRGVWPQELRDEVDALEDKFNVEMASMEFVEGWVRRCEDAEHSRLIEAPHTRSADCPTWYDRCHCSVQTLIYWRDAHAQQMDRADKADARLTTARTALEAAEKAMMRAPRAGATDLDAITYMDWFFGIRIPALTSVSSALAAINGTSHAVTSFPPSEQNDGTTTEKEDGHGRG